MNAQELRHRITVESKVATVDPTTGYATEGWAPRFAEPLAAAWKAGPGREYLAGEALRGQVTGRFMVRWSATAAAITAGDRVLWDGRALEIKAPPLADETARRWLTIMVADDGTDGG